MSDRGFFFELSKLTDLQEVVFHFPFFMNALTPCGIGIFDRNLLALLWRAFFCVFLRLDIFTSAALKSFSVGHVLLSTLPSCEPLCLAEDKNLFTLEHRVYWFSEFSSQKVN